MNSVKYKITTLLFLLALGTLAAQPGGDLPSGQVDVVRSFEARLAEAERIGVSPVLAPPDTNIRRQQYSVNARPLNMDYPAPIIRPRGVGRQRQEATQNGLIKVGAGFPQAFYGDLSYNITGLENFDLGFYAHRHSFNNTNNVENQRTSDTQFGAEGTYYNDKGFAINLGTKFSGQSRFYYGYNFPEMETDSLPSFASEEVRQRFNTFEINGSIFNGVRTQADFDYSADIDLYLLDATNATRENGIGLTLSATKWFADRDPLDITLRTAFTNYRDTSKQSINNFSLNPTYTLHIDDRLKIKLGANITSSDDDFNFFPDVEASAIVVPGVATVFIGAEGGLRINSFKSLSDYNPWIRTRLRIRNSEYTRLYGGVGGALYGISYRGEVSYNSIDRIALFQLDRSRDIPQFDVLYDTAKVVTIQGTVTIPVVENLDVSGTIAQHVYTLEREEKPWHLPSTTLNTAAIYTLAEQGLQLRADLFLENGVPFQTSAGEAANLNALFDLSLSGEYKITDNIGAWLQLNNLANNKRERFAQYPTIGFNVLGGVSVRF